MFLRFFFFKFLCGFFSFSKICKSNLTRFLQFVFVLFFPCFSPHLKLQFFLRKSFIFATCSQFEGKTTTVVTRAAKTNTHTLSAFTLTFAATMQRHGVFVAGRCCSDRLISSGGSALICCVASVLHLHASVMSARGACVCVRVCASAAQHERDMHFPLHFSPLARHALCCCCACVASSLILRPLQRQKNVSIGCLTGERCAVSTPIYLNLCRFPPRPLPQNWRVKKKMR